MIQHRRHVLIALASFALATTGRAYTQKGAAMDEAQQRKARSEAILQREGVPFIIHLPMVETVDEAKLRTTAETTERAIALLMAAIYGETADHALVSDLIEEWGASPHFSPDERRFVTSKTLEHQDRVNFSWRYEGVWVLLWALGFHDDLGRPDHVVNVETMAGMVREIGPAAFRTRARLRRTDSILDTLDLTYRYHWACVDARINDRDAPAKLDAGVVMERHYALNWLTCYGDQDWDDVSTDT